MQKFTILEVEERLLNHIKTLLKKENKYAVRNIFTAIKSTGIIRKINYTETKSDDFGYGHSLDTFTLSLLMNYYGELYKGTIIDSYYGGSCCICDDVERANSNNLDKEYMADRINSLKFISFNKIKPKFIQKKNKDNKSIIDITSMIEFPVLK